MTFLSSSSLPPPPLSLSSLLLLLLCSATAAAPVDPAEYTPAPVTVPAFPAVPSNQTCHLDLSAELFGGVAAACGGAAAVRLDRLRCCPVLAAWLFAAHARSALQLPSTSVSTAGDGDRPVMPDDSQRCVDALQSSLKSREIRLVGPNASCDAVLCFCGIRLHQVGSLSCPAAFDVGGGGGGERKNVTPTAAVKELERECRNSSYLGCTRCLQSLDKLKGGTTSVMFGRDCELMGLTWLLARNKTAYITTVSAVLRAVMYSPRTAAPPHAGGGGVKQQQEEYRCSPDRENMPLAVDSLQFEKLDASSPSSSSSPPSLPILFPLSLSSLFFLFLFLFWFSPLLS